MANIIEVKNLTVKFNHHAVIDNINFYIEKEDIAAVIGPNGSGKTTLLKAILGLIPYSGQIKIFNRNIREVLSQIGYVPQRFEFDKTFPITVEEFLKLSPAVKDAKKMKHIFEELEIERYRRSLIGRLSGGQMQRVLIARAVLGDPKILFLDEPTSGIDMEGIKDFYSIIGHMNKEHKVTILMISHEINMVYRFANKILCLNRDLVCQGTPKTALTAKVLKKLYGEEMDFREHHH